MIAITVEPDDDLADALRRLAAALQRSEAEVVREALVAYINEW